MSFLWGYFLHLTTDELWYLRLAIPTRQAYPTLFDEKGDQAWWVIKEDWYDLDHLYLRNHTDNIFRRIFLPQPDPPQYLPFLSAEGIKIQFAYIRDYYNKSHFEKGLDRLFPYLNEKTMGCFITETVSSLTRLSSILQRPLSETVGNMSLELMFPEEYAAFLTTSWGCRQTIKKSPPNRRGLLSFELISL